MERHQREHLRGDRKLRQSVLMRFLWLAVLVSVLIGGCTAAGDRAGYGAGSASGEQTGNRIGTQADLTTEAAADQIMKVHFIDVGQGDSALIESDGHYMLIDAGEKDQGPTVVSYLKAQGVKRLDYVVGTHPHSDHIGGLSAVLAAFPADCVLLPEKEHTTRAYEHLLDAVADQGLGVTLPVVGDIYELGNASFQILAPNGDYGDDLNNWSIGIRITNGENHFVFCGDAEKEAEQDMCGNGLELSADVLKLSHHGSYTSSSYSFMKRVNPQYAVISCGRNNDYGYPHRETKKMLADLGISVWRTDEQGTVTAASDGNSITFSNAGVEGDVSTTDGMKTTGDQTTSENQKMEPDYVLNTSTRRFHRPSCQSVQNMKEYNRKDYYGSREDLTDMGYEPCQSCKP